MKDIKQIGSKLLDFVERAKRYSPLLFCLLLALMYGFLIYRVQVLNSAEPSAVDTAAQSKTAQVPHIDQRVIDQLQSLQDNSVSVQSLFDQARSNPFQE